MSQSLAPWARLLGFLVLPPVVAFGPHLWRGEVLQAHDNRAEVGLDPSGHLGDSRLFIDQATLYLPEFWARAALPHRAPIATWNPHNSLGRPLTPSGMGGAFPLNHLIARANADPFHRYTYWVLAAALSTLVFAFGYLRCLRLSPEAAAAAALAISIGPIFGAYQVVPLIQWGFAFAFAALWAVERYFLRPGALPLLALAASVYGIVLAGFPQHVLLMAYPAATWTALRWIQQTRGTRQRIRFSLALVGACALGVISLAPALLDLRVDYRESSRGDFITATVAAATDWQEGLRFLVSLVAAPWEADRFTASISLTPLCAGLALLGAADRRPTTLAWSLWCTAILFASCLPAASRALRYLGVAFSEWPHVYAAQLPIAVLVALGAERALTSGRSDRTLRVGLMALPLLVFGACLPLTNFKLDAASAALSGTSAALALAFAYRPGPGLLLVAMLTALVGEQRALVHWISPERINRDSPLAARMRELTPAGTRFAWLGKRPEGGRFLLPNAEILLGLRSIHGYDHLVGRRFEAWAGRFADDAYRSSAFQRRFFHVGQSDPFLDEALDAAAVSLVASLAPIQHPRLGAGRTLGVVSLQRVLQPGALAQLIPAAEWSAVEGEWRLRGPEVLGRATTVECLSTGCVDHLRFRFPRTSAPALLFISQQHHPDWHARSLDIPLETAAVEGVFEGVLVPAGCSEVELHFERRIGYSLWVQAGYGVLFLGLLVHRGRVRTNARSLPRGEAT